MPRFLLLPAIAFAALFATLLLAGSSATAVSGLVAAYSFDEGSGTVATDLSGNGHPGTIQNAVRTSGHSGGALSFNGNNAYVDLPALGTFYKTGFTMEAWVKKDTANKGDAAVVGTWTGSGGGGPMLWFDYSNSHSTRPSRRAAVTSSTQVSWQRPASGST